MPGTPIAFLITLFSASTAGDEDPRVFDRVQRAIQDAASESGFNLERAHDIFRAGSISDHGCGHRHRSLNGVRGAIGSR